MKKAVVLLSGGLDSATCLALALKAGYQVHTLAFDYGQRHRAELLAAERVAQEQGVASHRIIRLDLGAIGGSALTDSSLAVPEEEGEGIPITYVPARNTVFLSLALGLAEVLDAAAIYIGINAVDYSGYPDCRPAFIDAFREMAALATRAGVEGHGPMIETPLLTLSKADIIATGAKLGVDYSLTVSCYQADDEGRACGRCDSCRLRRAGFDDAGLTDPTRYAP
ncbi:7-cyano-7-deazaguanine synthase QueC [Alcanivorax sp. JB21]|uniref:7-cyano-7-deazaguanine synthase QueC n=1 Tax=Alcanivorax limicola TaxID=2874102 RepID=UPI001CBD1F6D|nr:7-cyano-7-deazaguanine synthase QueC [Alcanivorax limicola]MBZ2189898.1 7-cyano-7-deazaguanine synthase QueC [Alcanivorax limicola]